MWLDNRSTSVRDVGVGAGRVEPPHRLASRFKERVVVEADKAHMCPVLETPVPALSHETCVEGDTATQVGRSHVVPTCKEEIPQVKAEGHQFLIDHRITLTEFLVLGERLFQRRWRVLPRETVPKQADHWLSSPVDLDEF